MVSFHILGSNTQTTYWPRKCFLCCIDIVDSSSRSLRNRIILIEEKRRKVQSKWMIMWAPKMLLLRHNWRAGRKECSIFAWAPWMSSEVLNHYYKHGDKKILSTYSTVLLSPQIFLLFMIIFLSHLYSKSSNKCTW